MNYQAIARDNSGQILADREISIEIQLNADSPDGKAAYTERHYLKTNNLGLFNMIIGEGIPVYGTFSEVPWSQSDIWLTISLDENGGNNFQLLNSSRLLAVPYAFHAASAETLIIHEHQEKRRCPITGLPFWSILGNDNVTDTCHFIGTTIPEDLVFRTDSIERMRITAAGDIIIGGDLVVLGNVDVGIDLSVGNDASIGNNLDVTNNANIGGDLTVGGDGEFFNLNVLNDLSVGRDGAFTRDVSIGNDLDVSSDAQIDGAATIEGQLNANGRLIVTGGASGPDNTNSSYPAPIQGSNQGLAITPNANRNTANNFISFWDNNGMHGRIEGQTNAELSLDPEYIFENSILVAQEGIAIADEVAALSSTTLCANAGGPCITAPIPSLITAASANLVVQTAQIVGYNTFRQTNIGVTYQSGAGDYAEWLPKANPEEAFQPGDIIGVKGGQISHKSTDAELLMVISHRQIIFGNMASEEEL